ncbi:MAG TPA: hypothetical protein VFV50_14495, partial [Bdellovibrionales bacterium]|nr:hypothetical protein [Bdellovibrionales bacterium]
SRERPLHPKHAMSNRIAYILAAALLGLPASSHAQSCNQAAAEPAVVVVTGTDVKILTQSRFRIRPEDPSITRSDVAFYGKLTRALVDFLKPFGKLENFEVNLHQKSKWGGSEDSGYLGRITVTLRENLAEAAAVYIHEFGHMLLENLLPKSVGPVKYKFLEAEHTRRDPGGLPSERARNMADIEQGLAEFFCDVLAVVFLKNPEALTTATSEGVKRSFSARHPVDTWTDTSQHTMYSPARSHVGNYLETKGYQSQLEVVRTVLEALTAELAARYENPPKRLDPAELNRSLIERIRWPN